jgi:hypothetical protein
MSLPYVDKELIEWLERIYPDRTPSIEMTDRQIWVQRGNINVVLKLRDLYEEQIKNSLTSM